MFEVSKINYLAKTNTNRYKERLSNMLLFAKIDHFGYAYHETIKSGGRPCTCRSIAKSQCTIFKHTLN